MRGNQLGSRKARSTHAGSTRPSSRCAVHPRVAASAGVSLIEAMVALAIVGIVLVAAWGWQGTLATWKVRAAASLLESDLRYARQLAIASGGNGPQVEVCFRADGYDVDTTTYGSGDVLDVNPSTYTTTSGTVMKRVNAGQEYDAGVQFTLPGSSATVSCTADSTETAVAFRASGQPLFSDGASHAITVTYQGRSAFVTIQPVSGAVTVSQ